MRRLARVMDIRFFSTPKQQNVKKKTTEKNVGSLCYWFHVGIQVSSFFWTLNCRFPNVVERVIAKISFGRVLFGCFYRTRFIFYFPFSIFFSLCL